MKPIDIIWYPYRPQYWDDAFLEQMFEQNPPGGYEFRECTPKGTRSDDGPRPEETGGIVVVSGRAYNDGKCTLGGINDFIFGMPWVLMIVTGDEEGRFPYDQIEHPNKKVWAMMPRVDTKADRYLPCGYPLGFRNVVRLASLCQNDRYQDWFFSGQVTHSRREMCVDQLHGMNGGVCLESKGFAQGLPQEEYYRQMSGAKIIPCPAGMNTPDSFRFAEALELGCVPIVDYRAQNVAPGYWEKVFGASPFRLIDDWCDLPTMMAEELSRWSSESERLGAWWTQYKRQMAYNLRDDLNELQQERPVHDEIANILTVLISSSPIPSHPSTEMIEQTIASIRYHLPNVEIRIMLDGVRPQQEHRREQYEAYKRAVVWKCQHEWKNVIPVISNEFLHQAGMTALALKGVQTQFVFFVEHDMLIEPRAIDWHGILQELRRGVVNLVRLYQQEEIIPVHFYLMEDNVDCATPLIKTTQYSQHPHIASVDFYKRILSHFREGSRTMIEDNIYGHIDRTPWESWKLSIYAPAGGYKRVSWNDGRGTDPKYDMIY